MIIDKLQKYCKTCKGARYMKHTCGAYETLKTLPGQEMKESKSKIKIIQPDDMELVPVEVLAQSIKKLGYVHKSLQDNGLSERAILLLIHDLTGLAKRDIKAVLNSLGDLEKTYLKQTKVKINS